jgi:enolase-phosphatase E1
VTRAVLLDIEGTTSPLTFATEVLFPYARAHVRDFVARRQGDPAVGEALELLRAEQTAEGRGDLAPLEYIAFLMDEDRKSTGLKELQGHIWEEGFRAGALRGDLYPDVAPAFARWRAQGRRIAIYSSGSVLAQRLLFAATPQGDLTPEIAAFFDTKTGPKREAESYAKIARALGLPPAEILFVSDVAAELDAARAAGLQTALCVREAEMMAAPGHPVVTTFDTL